MQTVDTTMFCLISLLILALIGVSMREVDWSKESRKQRSGLGLTKRATDACPACGYALVNGVCKNGGCAQWQVRR